MVVGININAVGERYIAGLYFNDQNSTSDQQAVAKLWLNHYDEVYIVQSFDPANDDFINEIVLKGCRM